MGAAHNNSLDVGKSARNKASTRTPIHFWLDVPMYEYDIGCGTREHIHTFQSRTPLVPAEEHDDFVIVWCASCQKYQTIDGDNLAEPLNQPVSNDEKIAFEQDKGLLRERIAWHVQDLGYLDDDESIMRLAIQHGVPVAEIKKINAGLKAPETFNGAADLCAAGLHEMTIDNITVAGGRRRCKACRTLAQRARRAAKRG